MTSPIAPFVAPQAPPPPATPHAAPRAPAAHPFAEMLRQMRRPEAPAPTAAELPDAEAADTPEAPHPPAAAKAKARSASAPAPPRSATAPAARPDAPEAPAARPADRDTNAGATPNDGGLAQWIAQLQWPASGATDATRRGADAGEADPAQDVDAATSGSGRDPRSPTDARRPDADAKESATRAAFEQAATSRLEAAAATDAPRRAGEAAPDARAEPGAMPAPIGLATLPAPAAAATLPVADVTLPTPLHAPDFAQALGLQVSVLAKDGVQHAELHLNPAEMGPVSVQIVMDGTQARIDFGADLLQTRQALEAGIPELASALRDAGLTLSGGGVSEHARSRGDGSGDGPDPRRPRTVGAAGGAEPARAAGRRVALPGGVDVYA